MKLNRIRYADGQEFRLHRTILNNPISNPWLMIVFVCLFFSSPGQAFNLVNPEGLGISLVMTHHDDYPIGKSGIGSGFYFYLKYRNPSNTFLSIGSGFFTITDDVFKMKQYQTTVFPSLEICYGTYLSQSRTWHPSFYGGINGFAAFDKVKTKTSRTHISERFLQMCGLLGGGLEIQPNYLYSIHINADYRYVFLASEHDGRQFIVIRIGLLFYQ
ncbi:hypothetical protein JW835_05370 [bacterium]|nr:hypothetical protein [bacterium]